MFLPHSASALTLPDDLLSLSDAGGVDPVMLSVLDDISRVPTTPPPTGVRVPAFVATPGFSPPRGTTPLPMTPATRALLTDVSLGAGAGADFLTLPTQQPCDPTGTPVTNSLSAASSLDSLFDFENSCSPQSTSSSVAFRPTTPCAAALYSASASAAPTAAASAAASAASSAPASISAPVSASVPSSASAAASVVVAPASPVAQKATATTAAPSAPEPKVSPQRTSPITPAHQQTHRNAQDACNYPGQAIPFPSYNCSTTQSRVQAQFSAHSPARTGAGPQVQSQLNPHVLTVSQTRPRQQSNALAHSCHHSHAHRHSHPQPYQHINANPVSLPTVPSGLVQPVGAAGISRGGGAVGSSAGGGAARRYKIMQPSKFCHVCVRSGELVTLAPCANVLRGVCRKAICRKCFDKHGRSGEWAAAASNSTLLASAHAEAAATGQAPAQPAAAWTCLHCRSQCPPSAQCKIYARTNRRRHLLLKERKAIRTRVATAQAPPAQPQRLPAVGGVRRSAVPSRPYLEHHLATTAHYLTHPQQLSYQHGGAYQHAHAYSQTPPHAQAHPQGGHMY